MKKKDGKKIESIKSKKNGRKMESKGEKIGKR